jgi:hypothetical protein
LLLSLAASTPGPSLATGWLSFKAFKNGSGSRPGLSTITASPTLAQDRDHLILRANLALPYDTFQEFNVSQWRRVE